MKDLPDIYFDRNYGKLYEKMEHGVAQVFHFKNEHGEILHQFIKREIPVRVNDDILYDLITPYGYGGPLILNCDGNKEQLVQEFYNEFSKYCKRNNIVSEFVRFHPVIENAKDFADIYNTVFDRHTVGTDLKSYTIEEEFSKSARKSIRQALKKGITYSVKANPDSLEEFKKIYRSTMNRNEASDYYYFDDDYFSDCLRYYGKNILLVEAYWEGKTIAAGLYFFYGKIIAAHLSGTLSEYLHLSPAYIIKYATAEWAKNNGIEYIHYGGGTDKSEDNPLYLFKKKFGKNTELDFYLGKKIWNKKLYIELCRITGSETDMDFFPAYRGKRESDVCE